MLVFKFGILASASVPVVILLASKFAILAAATVPVSISEPLRSVIPEPIPEIIPDVHILVPNALVILPFWTTNNWFPPALLFSAASAHANP